MEKGCLETRVPRRVEGWAVQDMHTLLTAVARIGKVVGFSSWQEDNLIKVLKTCLVPS